MTSELLFANLVYLGQHGLIDLAHDKYYEEERYILTAATTNRGMNFMADDGGLSAILGVVSIKLHDDTIKALIETRIIESDLAEPEKKRFLDQLREQPGETTTHPVLKRLDLWLDNSPQAIAMI